MKKKNKKIYNKERYIRRLKRSDRFLDFDRFDHPFGGGNTIFTYPKITSYLLFNYNFGVFKYGGSNVCYAFGISKKELKSCCP